MREVNAPSGPLDDFSWSTAGSRVIGFLSRRDGWEDMGLSFEYRPSRPACLDTLVDRSMHPCSGTTITSDMDVYTPEASCPQCLADLPGQRPVDSITLTVGYDHPEDIRRHILLIEAIRWSTTGFGVLLQDAPPA
ncbi:hypothetical protein [Catellatospora sp. NPDC049133]|uniref:hypothetical protein n=1 Tax=Catellatospora sp. NPDC049133 TaxID=3155499 RepID=UPI0033E36A93